MSEERKFPAKVAMVRDSSTVVINRGSGDNVKKGDNFLIYALGEEIIDPDTKESLGRLEIIRGKGLAEHVQEKMTTVVSSKTIMPDKKVVYRTPSKNNNFASVLLGLSIQTETKEEVFEKPRIVPFEGVQEGDLVKPI